MDGLDIYDIICSWSKEIYPNMASPVNHSKHSTGQAAVGSNPVFCRDGRNIKSVSATPPDSGAGHAPAVGRPFLHI